uniref:Putative homing endonuclease n=1 Tax=viral metagenome TaxID=1070528 RepID=A0A6M3LYY8_9ZZZZ
MQKNYKSVSNESAFSPLGLSDEPLSAEASLFNIMETKDISFATNYFVTSEGKVFSKNYCKRHYCQEMALHPSISGYPKVNLRVNGKTKAFLVHRLVAKAFIPNPKKLDQVNHLDFHKYNNYVENLEWCTPLQNLQYTLNHGRGNRVIGEAHGKHKLVDKDIIQIRKIYSEKRLMRKEIAEIFKVSPATISSVVKRLTWKHI